MHANSAVLWEFELETDLSWGPRGFCDVCEHFSARFIPHLVGPRPVWGNCIKHSPNRRVRDMVRYLHSRAGGVAKGDMYETFPRSTPL